MDELDGDDVRLSFQGRVAERDIVQVIMCLLSSSLQERGKGVEEFSNQRPVSFSLSE